MKGRADRMERTQKVKIALGATLCLLAAAFLLQFFPVREELSPFAPDAPVGEARYFDAVEIAYFMTYCPANGRPLNFYLLRSADGTEALLSDTQTYNDETFSEPVRFTGYASLPLGGAAERLTPQCIFSEAALARYGDAQVVLQTVSQSMVLRLNTRAGEHPSVAFVCVSAAAMLSFCVFLAMLLKEYFGGKRKRAKDDEDA